MRESVVTSLFCLQEDPAPDPGCSAYARADGGDGFRALLPRLNLDATCYLVGSARETAGAFFLDRLQDVSAFLQRHAFLQVSLRPVHPFPGRWSQDGWMELYERFLVVLGPFQREGYREQIVSRLRIFPVLFFPDAEAVASSLPFLAYLRKNFFLPSVLLPEREAGSLAALADGAGEAAWERVCLTGVETYAHPGVLRTLHGHALADLVLDGALVDPFHEGDSPCREIAVLAPGGGVKRCPRGEGPEAVDGAGRCGACIAGILDETAASFRVDGRADAWREVAERFAGALRRHGHPGEAVAVWEACLRGGRPEKVPLHHRLQKALCRLEMGDPETAMTELHEACRLHPDSPEVRFYMGRCEFGWRDYIEAADRFREALERGLVNPMRQEAEYLRGESHVHLEEYDAALEALRRAEREGRGDSPLYFYQGLCLLGTGDPGGAVTLLKRALDAGPSEGDLFHVLFYIAHALKENGDYGQALPYCARAEPLAPQNLELHNLKGFCHFKLGEYDAAIGCFRRCVEINPRSAIDYANIGSNLREKGDLRGACAMYRKALSMDPGIEFARENLERIEKVLPGQEPP